MKKVVNERKKKVIIAIAIVLIVFGISVYLTHLYTKQNVQYSHYEEVEVLEDNEINTETEQPQNLEIYTIEDGYISRILPLTTLDDFKNNLDETNLIVYKKDGITELQSNELVGTGMKLVYGENEYKLAVLGDINGDGKVGITDITQITLSNVGLRPSLVDEYQKAGDMNENGIITITDVTRVNLAVVDLIDIVAPNTFVPEAISTRDTIIVSGNTVDTNSGVKEYWFELDNNGWVQNEDVRESQYIFTNLENETEHTVRMKVVDNEGNTKITKRVKASTLDTENANISIVVFPTEWTNKDVFVIVNYNSNVAKEIKQVSLDNGATWVEYTRPLEVEKNIKIKARVTNKEGTVLEEVEKEIINIDKLEPNEFEITIEAQEESITIDAETTDQVATEVNGCSGIKEYTYILKDGRWNSKQTTEENTYTFENLEPGKEYTVEVIAKDNAGNEKEATNSGIIIKTLMPDRTLEINPNGGEWEGKAEVQIFVQKEETTKEIVTPTKEGYTFEGWELEGEGTIANGIYTYGSGDAKLIAKWVANINTKYVVNHYKMGLDGTYPKIATESEEKTGTTGEEVTPGVKTYEGFTSPAVQKVTIAADGTTVVTYKYARNKYAFILGSATGVSTAGSTLTGEYYYGATITLKATVNESYAWSKWISSNIALVADIAEVNTTITMPAGEVTMTPKVTSKIYIITLDDQGATRKGTTAIYEKYGTGIYTNATCSTPIGTTGIAIPVKYYTITYATNGGTLSQTSATVSQTFGGYYTQTSGNGEQLIGTTGQLMSKFTNTKFTDNATLYAKWTGKSVTLPTPTRSGYTFKGWYTEASLTNKISTSTYTPTKNITLYAKWEVAACTITYNMNWVNQNGTYSTQSATIGQTTTLNKMSGYKERPLFKFVGWSENSKATTATYTDGGTITPTGDVNLYAVWEIDTEKYKLWLSLGLTSWTGGSVESEDNGATITPERRIGN